MSNEEILKKKIIQLSPWHLDVKLSDTLSTAYFKEVPEESLPKHEFDVGNVSFINPKSHFISQMGRIYPNGLAGKRFLDCACNCGAYCFWAKEMGAAETFGFDVRDHWINQAKFLQESRIWPTEGMNFNTLNLYDLPTQSLEPFDITIFKGIFYHLPDPMTGLKLAADLTKEILILDTSTMTYFEQEPARGILTPSYESVEKFMSGVHKLNWFPSGPNILNHILNWLGFCETKVVSEIKPVPPSDPSFSPQNRLGRISIIASKVEGLLENL